MSARAHALPLGADLGGDAVSLVSALAGANGFVVREATTQRVESGADGERDRALASTVRFALAALGTRERRCVLAAPADQLATRIFMTPAAMGRAERERAASLEADALVPWTESERLVALDALPGRADAHLLSVTRCSAVERLVSIARAGGLRPIAVDVPFCAWRRALPHVDAVLDVTAERPSLTIFGDPLGTTVTYPARLVDERLAGNVRTALVDARRDAFADVRRIAVCAPSERFDALAPLLRSDGYDVAAVRLGEVEAPPWTFAYGLASWAVAPRGIATP